MPSSRPNLTLDEQSFQGLLSAAFIIQEHNDRQKQARQAQAESEGKSSGQDELRPGERLQHNWASMWLMSQERGLWPERSAEAREAPSRDGPPLPAQRGRLAPAASDFAASSVLALPVEKKSAKETITQEKPDSIHDAVRGRPVAKAAAQGNWITEAEDDAEEFAPEEFPLHASDDSLPIEASDEFTAARPDTAAPISFLQRFADWRVKLRFQRADLYLGTAIFVAALALLWPASGSLQPAALSPWERALITLGIAEAPAPVIHFQGDPGIEVWVDPHSALYYCPGEEQYGKTSGGRLSSQREAQMDRFEPAGRSACE